MSKKQTGFSQFDVEEDERPQHYKKKKSNSQFDVIGVDFDPRAYERDRVNQRRANKFKEKQKYHEDNGWN